MNLSEQIKELFKKLDSGEQGKLLIELTTVSKDSKRTEVNALDIECPYCKSKNFVKNGMQKGYQRFKCNSCNRNFMAITGTIFQGIKKKVKFDEYKTIMLNEGLISLDQMATRLGISIQTSFDWRHKILCSLKPGTGMFKGNTEIDDVWFLYSQKGRKGLAYSRKRGGSKRKGDNDFQVKMLITSDRNHATDLSVVRIGRLKSKDITGKIAKKIDQSCTLISDKHRSISAFAKQNHIKHLNFKSSDHAASSQIHVQTVNNLASRIKGKLNHSLRGVSTKYLQSYANWFQFYETNKHSKNISSQADNDLLNNNTSWNIFTNIEVLYKRFIKEYSNRTYRCPTQRRWKTQLKDTLSLNSLSYY